MSHILRQNVAAFWHYRNTHMQFLLNLLSFMESLHVRPYLAQNITSGDNLKLVLLQTRCPPYHKGVKLQLTSFLSHNHFKHQREVPTAISKITHWPDTSWSIQILQRRDVGLCMLPVRRQNQGTIWIRILLLTFAFLYFYFPDKVTFQPQFVS